MGRLPWGRETLMGSLWRGKDFRLFQVIQKSVSLRIARHRP